MPQSNFQDTFTKNDGEKNLQYDDSAFYFFASALLTLVLIPLTISLFRAFRARRKLQVHKETLCDCHACKARVPQLIRLRKHPTSFYFKLAVLGLLLYLLSACGSRAAASKSFKTFDPYEILDVMPNASKADIKRQYKQLARKLHPDNNPGDPDANQKYILLNKAYSCLTDENAMASCEKYGSPDGAPGAFQVGIALPSFLLKKENKLVILALFFILLLIVLPATVFYLYQSSENLDEYGTNKGFMPLAIEILRNENILFKNFIEIIVMTDELRPFLGARPDQIQALEKLRDPEFVPKFGLQRFRPFLKPFYLLHAYMNGRSIPAALQDDLFEILKGVVKVLNSLVDFSIQLYAEKRMATYLLGKPLAFASIERLLHFSQCFYQGLWLHESSLLQLPHFTREGMGAGFKRRLKKIETLKDLRACEDPAGRLLELFEKDTAIVADITRALDTISDLRVTAESFVELEGGATDPEVCVGDIFTIKIEVRRLNRKTTYAHSKVFPFLKKEGLILLLLDPETRDVIHFKRFNQLDAVLTEELRDAARTPGKFRVKAVVKSDCYVDVDCEADFEFVVKPFKREQPDGQYIHPDDEKALKEASFMKALIKDIGGKEVDSDEELEAGELEEETEEKQNADGKGGVVDPRELEEDEIKETK